LYTQYKDDGLVVVGFPSNDFKQEHADESKVAEVCQLDYGINFPMFELSSVRGNNADPLFAKLAQEAGGKSPQWNFNKYLMNKTGTAVTHYGSSVKPLDSDFIKDVKNALNSANVEASP
jgi:glutathione peroxidase